MTTIDVGPEEIVFFGATMKVMAALAKVLPDNAIVVVEEPDVVRKRDLRELPNRLPVVSRLIECEYLNQDELQRLLSNSCFSRFRAAVAVLEYGVPAAAAAAELLHLPGVGVRAAAIFRDKHAVRELAAAAGLRNPRFALVAGPDDAVAFLRSTDQPCVLKPTTRQASLGVQIVSTGDDIHRGWPATANANEGRFEPDRGITGAVLIEELIKGPEYSVELLLVDGKAVFANVTAKTVAPGRYPVEIGHVAPAPIDAVTRGTLVSATETLLTAAEFGTGTAHCEWILAEAGPVLVECAARLAGDDIPLLVSLAYDFPMEESLLRLMLGEAPILPASAVGSAAVRFVVPTAEGEVANLVGLDAARALPGVVAADFTVKVGDSVRLPQSSWDRAGHVVARGKTQADAVAAAEAAAQTLSIDVRTPG